MSGLLLGIIIIIIIIIYLFLTAIELTPGGSSTVHTPGVSSSH
jgi:hypothetical protein